ncbi:hypothetical protein B0H63DRAFT_489915 [Podospora didyma]|uniref:Uncharacterized protein n=1 Tax=Podospora didyma TaxID=330526 RepID=A0AAE0K0M5_9PEZI|nr:hypothetical protein B0H63DRAFT_489915 [Podospora didyma]
MAPGAKKKAAAGVPAGDCIEVKSVSICRCFCFPLLLTCPILPRRLGSSTTIVALGVSCVACAGFLFIQQPFSTAKFGPLPPVFLVPCLLFWPSSKLIAVCQLWNLGCV